MTGPQLQAMIDGMNAAHQKARSTTQLTLGALIALLETLAPESRVYGLGRLMSYRGYYCDLAFAPTDEVETTAALLARCRDAMGRVFQGYKGGDYQMGETTPLWVAPYGGSSADRLMGLNTEQIPVTPILSPEPSE